VHKFLDPADLSAIFLAEGGIELSVINGSWIPIGAPWKGSTHFGPRT
jgi:hypothetical protein